MEIRHLVHRTTHKKRLSHNNKQSHKLTDTTTTTTPRLKWMNIFFQRSPPSPQPSQTPPPPEEFICPISGTLMAEPVIVSSGHSFERAFVQSCKDLNFLPTLPDGTTPDFSAVIPNLALKSAIAKWCRASSTLPPQPPDQSITDAAVRTLITRTTTTSHQQHQQQSLTEPIEERMAPSPPSVSSSSVESIATSASSSAPRLQLIATPSCHYSSSSSSSEHEPSPPEAEGIFSKLRSQQVFLIEEALLDLRNLTRTKEESRISLCTNRMLSSLRNLASSKYKSVQVNAIASIVNLSLERANKVRIVRSGIVPPLIEALKAGSSEAQEHAAGAIFSLALEDDNKTAIGVLGALPPLLHVLRVGTERTRHDSALALYHLSMVQSNRTKMVKFGSVPVMIGMVNSGHMTGRVISILGNLGCGSDGRAAMLDAGAVECLVGLLGRSGSILESCVAVLYALSHGGLRFKAVAKAAGVVEAVERAEKELRSERAREKARRILEVMRGKEAAEEEEEVDWEELLDSGLGCRTRSRRDSGLDGSSTPSSEF